MRIYRIAKNSFIQDLSGEGARLFGGRWNKKGEALLYFSEHLSLSVLELLTRLDYDLITKDYSYIEIEVPSLLIEKAIKPEVVSTKWRTNPAISQTQDFGSAWIKKNSGLGILVPSAVLPQEKNILINPNNKLVSKLTVITIAPLNLDSRIL